MSERSKDWTEAVAPSLEDFAVLAEAALKGLPEPFHSLALQVQMRVLDWPPEEVLDELGIEDPFELTGLYEGSDLRRRSVFDLSPQPSMLFLYRRPILDEWCDRGDVTLGELVTHVLTHEIAHHFGLSDEDIEGIEAGE